MAICRCLENHAWPKGTKNEYVAYAYPVGYPDTAALCAPCQNPGVIWLTEEEVVAFESGQRVFKMLTHTVWLKADDRPLVKRVK